MGKNSTRIKFFIGIDVSKSTFNYCIKFEESKVINGKTANNTEAIKQFLQDLTYIPGYKIANAIFGMEVTGIYGQILIRILSKVKAKVVVEPAIRIKNSLGLIRGKNDKLDVARICRYLIKNLHDLKFWQPRRKIIDELHSLETLRERIEKVNKIMSIPLAEDLDFIDPKIANSNISLCQESVEKLNLLTKTIEARIKSICSQDDKISRKMEIMLSVVGIGPVTALAILIHSNEFQSIKDARSFASYCGVAPFEHLSGTSIKNQQQFPKSLTKISSRFCTTE